MFVATKDMFCRDKQVFVLTNVCLLQQKLYMWQLPPMICVSVSVASSSLFWPGYSAIKEALWLFLFSFLSRLSQPCVCVCMCAYAYMHVCTILWDVCVFVCVCVHVIMCVCVCVCVLLCFVWMLITGGLPASLFFMCLFIYHWFVCGYLHIACISLIKLSNHLSLWKLYKFLIIIT